MSEWQPIETAPKEGDFLIGWDRGLFGRGWITYIGRPVERAWFDRETGKRLPQATHWMPLPAPPVQPERVEG